MNSIIKDTKAVLLVGGLGTRLRSVVPFAPKPLASVGDRPFLELLVRQLGYQGSRRLVMCTGYRGQDIENEFRDGRALDVAIEYSREVHPMGTAGAVKLAEPLLRGEPDILVMNGDSFTEIDLTQLVDFHRGSGGIATIAVLQLNDKERYGTVRVAPGGRVTGFTEKSDSDSSGLVNAGIYVFDRRIFDYIPDGPASLERDVFPRILDQGVYALEQHGVFVDIGTPDDYERAQGLLERLEAAARRK
jgi:NDP-sugar pyrophosphorylase family protein